MDLQILSTSELEALDRLYASEDTSLKHVAGKIRNDPKWPREASDLLPLLLRKDPDARVLGFFLVRLLRCDT